MRPGDYKGMTMRPGDYKGKTMRPEDYKGKTLSPGDHETRRLQGQDLETWRPQHNTVRPPWEEHIGVMMVTLLLCAYDLAHVTESEEDLQTMLSGCASLTC